MIKSSDLPEKKESVDRKKPKILTSNQLPAREFKPNPNFKRKDESKFIDTRNYKRFGKRKKAK